MTAGGAIYFNFNAYTYLYDSSFTRCTSTTFSGQARAGGVIITVSMTGAFIGCSFTDCAAISTEGDAFGGAVMHYLSYSTFSGCIFSGCRAATSAIGSCFGGAHPSAHHAASQLWSSLSSRAFLFGRWAIFQAGHRHRHRRLYLHQLQRHLPLAQHDGLRWRGVRRLVHGEW